MSISEIIIAVLFAAFAVSYGWGVRGYIIGGEKGALLPGALLGLSISLFCCKGALIDFCPFFCAAGALTMFYGGTEPYAQTMSYILKRDDINSFAYDNLKKGVVGIFLKGGLWFGITGLILGILPGALNGTYSEVEIILMFISIPFISFFGRKIFNSPFDREKNIFPALYFSNGSREEWGGNVLVLIEFSFIALLHKDYFAFCGTVFGIIFGGIGFVLGLFIYDFCVRKHNGKYFFGKFQEKGYIDGWKIMEHTLGALGGAGVMLWFCMNSDYISTLCNKNTFAGIQVKSGITDIICSVSVVVMLLITAIQYFIVYRCNKKGIAEPDVFIFEISERPLFSSIPLVFIYLGYEKTAMTVALLTLLYALCEKCCFEWFNEQKNSKVMSAIFAGIFFVGVLLFCLIKTKIPIIAITLFYTFGYTLPILYKSYNGYQRKDRKSKNIKIMPYYKSRITVDFHFVIQCIIITAVSVVKIYL